MRSITPTLRIPAVVSLSLALVLGFSVGPAAAMQAGTTIVTDGSVPFMISGSVLPGVFNPPSSLTVAYECHAVALASSNVAIPTANEDDPDEHGCSLWQDQTVDPNPTAHNWVEIDFIDPGTSAPGEANVVGTAEDVTVSGKGLRVCWYGFATALVGGDPVEGRGCSDGTGGATVGTGDLFDETRNHLVNGHSGPGVFEPGNNTIVIPFGCESVAAPDAVKHSIKSCTLEEWNPVDETWVSRGAAQPVDLVGPAVATEEVQSVDFPTGTGFRVCWDAEVVWSDGTETSLEGCSAE